MNFFNHAVWHHVRHDDLHSVIFLIYFMSAQLKIDCLPFESPSTSSMMVYKNSPLNFLGEITCLLALKYFKKKVREKNSLMSGFPFEKSPRAISYLLLTTVS